MATAAKVTGAITRWWWVRHAPVPNPEARCYGQSDKDCDVSNEALFKHQAALLPKGAVILLTGGAQGLGKLLSKEFTTKHKDVKLVIIDVQPALGQATVEELKKDTGVQSIEYINVDISDQAALNAAWK